MLALLQHSTLVESFAENEREEVVQMCIDKYGEIFEKYTNSDHLSESMMDEVIDMYLFIGVKPSAKLLDNLKRYLLEGKVFSKLDIYMHLPQYEQIVKLLRPEYYAEVDRSKFRVFTINEYIYNIASQQYTIEETFGNAYSVWFIKKIVDKHGVTPGNHSLHFYLENGPVDCVKYMVHDIHTSSIDFSLVMSCFKGDNVDTLKYLLSIANVIYIARHYLKRFAAPNIRKFMAPLLKDAMDKMFNEKQEEALVYALSICPMYIYNKISYILHINWIEGLKIVLKQADIYGLYVYIMNEGSEEAKQLAYNKLLERQTPQEILTMVAYNNADNIFIAVHKLNPIDLTQVFKIHKVYTIGTATYCVSNGYIVTEDDVIESLKDHMPYIQRYLIDAYGKFTTRIMYTAIQHDKCDMMLYMYKKGAKLDKSYISKAIEYKKPNICAWLVDAGCPIDPNDVVYVNGLVGSWRKRKASVSII